MILICVESEEEKENLLAESKYVHDHFCKDFDSDYCNTLMHLYRNPDMFKVVSRSWIAGAVASLQNCAP